MQDAFLPKQTPSTMRSVAAPKVVGTRHVLNIAQMLPTMQIQLFSSTSALICPVGQSNYASANAQLNALASSYNAMGKLTLGHLLAQTHFSFLIIDLGMLHFSQSNLKQGNGLFWVGVHARLWNED